MFWGCDLLGFMLARSPTRTLQTSKMKALLSTSTHSHLSDSEECEDADLDTAQLAVGSNLVVPRQNTPKQKTDPTPFHANRV